MLNFLPHAGIILGVGLVWYGRTHNSDARIIGYIILAPSLFGLLRQLTGVDVNSPKVMGGAPASGEAFPQPDTTVADPYATPKGDPYFDTDIAQSGNLSFGVDPHYEGIVRPPGSGYGKLK